MTTSRFDLDLLRALQYLYYVDSDALVSDYVFDMMEKAYEAKWGAELPLGSDHAADYSDAQRHLASYIRRAGLPVTHEQS